MKAAAAQKRPRHAAGRWALLRACPERHERAKSGCERFARQLLLRWGVLLRDLLVRETLAPPWRDLLPVLRRMEARGEIRGGRFVSGFTGEQFARPEALDLLRAIRRTPDSIRRSPFPMRTPESQRHHSAGAARKPPGGYWSCGLIVSQCFHGRNARQAERAGRNAATRVAIMSTAGTITNTNGSPVPIPSI